MPNIWTHMIYGQDLLRRLGKEELINTSFSQNIYQFACQGPDYLFYHRFWPWKKDKRMNKLGSAMHNENCGPFLLGLLDAARISQQHDLILYAYGFLAHHLLDRNLHPYIFYKSGFGKFNHQRFEVIMDTIMVKKFMQLYTWNTPVWKQIDLGPRLPNEIAELMDAESKKHYPVLGSAVQISDWHDAYRDMLTAHKLFHDPLGWKRVVTLGQITPLVYKKKNAPLDYFNEAREPWEDPTNGMDIFHHSVWDLWELAMIDGQHTMAAAISYVQREAVDNQLLADALGDISYETGKPCANGDIIQFVQPII